MLRARRRNASLAGLAAALIVGGCSPEPDVYVAGWEWNGTALVAKVWKNGAATALSDGTQGALATAVAVSGGDVFVAGGVDGGGADIATYWKNGAAVPLTDGATQAFANAIAVSGADVYVAGYQGATAMYWRNGAPVALTNGVYDADALAVAVSGGDVYVAGWEVEVTEVAPGSFIITNVAKVWKNGVATALTDGTNPAVARDIAVVGPDVYVAGAEREDAPWARSVSPRCGRTASRWRSRTGSTARWRRASRCGATTSSRRAGSTTAWPTSPGSGGTGFRQT